MKALSKDQFETLIEQAQMRPRLKRELRFMASTATMSDEAWSETELLAITDRSRSKGVLLLAPASDIYVLPYELRQGAQNRQTGRSQPIICDLCRTWQSGSNAGYVTFQKDRQSINSVSFLCCADLACSQHVRTATASARTSRAQLREDLTDEQRVNRLRNRLQQLIADFELKPAA